MLQYYTDVFFIGLLVLLMVVFNLLAVIGIISTIWDIWCWVYARLSKVSRQGMGRKTLGK